MAREAMSRGDLLLLVVVLALAGTVVGGYLTWEWYASANANWCDLNSYFNCSRVRASSYAAVGGVPTALVGAVGFVLLLAFAVLELRGVERLGPWSLDAWLLAFAVLGALVGLGLSFLEVFVIQAVCILCVTGFALDLGILGTAVLLRRSGGPAAES